MNQFHMSSLPAPVLEALVLAGWKPNRRMDISTWVKELEPQGYVLSEVAGSLLEALGGLVIEPLNTKGPNFSNDEPLSFDPISAGSGHKALYEEIRDHLGGGSWYPIGEWLSGASVFIETGGLTVATGLGWIWEMGASPEQAVELAVEASRPLRCLATLAPGAEPWPPLP